MQEPLVSYTLFQDKNATEKVERNDVPWSELASRIKNAATYIDKQHCPLISLSDYGENVSDKGCIRHAANVRRIFGVEIDYDGEQMPLALAAQRLQEAHVTALLYTSPSHKPNHPRWRALLPLAEPATPVKRADFVGRANRILGGVATRESFTLSQSFFIGRVKGAEYEVAETQGRFIDEAIDIEPQYFIGRGQDGESKIDRTTDEELRAAFARGEDRYQAMLKLSSRWAARGMGVDDIESALGAMLGSGNPKNADSVDLRTRIRPIAQSAVRKFGESRACREPAAEGAPAARVHVSTNSYDAEPEANLWPVLNPAALLGIVGGIVEAACENSEADPAAVLASTLTWFGCSFGTLPHVMVGDTQHFSRFFCFKVGATAKARKGTSEDPPRRIFRKAEALEIDGKRRTPLVTSAGPLSTGEGLVRAVRDASEEENEDGRPIDPGVSDKRLLVIEGELGAPLKAAQREGNTLSAILRMAWDSGDIAPLTKSNRIRATGAHICVIGHITRGELTQLLRTTDIWNGFANRVLWFCVRRAKRVPFPEPMGDGVVEALARVVRDILDHAAEGVERMTWSEEAKAHWRELYPLISSDQPGAFGAVTARAEAQLQRLSLVYALIGRSPQIEHRHFLAAAAVWEYAQQSARLIFEGIPEDPKQTRVIELLKGGPLTQSQINAGFAGHLPSAELKALLEELQASGVIRAVKEKTSGRPVTTWSLISQGAEEAKKAGEQPPGATYSAKPAYSAGSDV